ncbi:MAG: homoserine kinase [Candidatus Thermoplasmatota archaeon]|jgi:homoserine kinase type II|nr:homoserine kinase [Candidatus Thermoplasmatota archaeon]
MELSIGNVHEIIKFYNISGIKDLARLHSGYANTNFCLRTNSGDYLLKIFEEKSIEDIHHEIAVLNYLREEKYPAAFPVARSDGKYITKSLYGNVVLYDFIDGNDGPINPRTVAVIARTVAKLHLLEGWRSFDKENSLSIGLCERTISRFSSSKNKYPEIFDFFREETDFLTYPLLEKLPRGLIHGDIFPDNSIWSGDRLLAIVDFEEICTDHLLFDVGVTINGFCFVDNRLNHELKDIFIKEYNSKRKMEPRELELLPYYIQWGAHVMICWHLKHLLDFYDSRKMARLSFFMERVQKLRKKFQ